MKKKIKQTISVAAAAAMTATLFTTAPVMAADEQIVGVAGGQFNQVVLKNAPSDAQVYYKNGDNWTPIASNAKDLSKYSTSDNSAHVNYICEANANGSTDKVISVMNYYKSPFYTYETFESSQIKVTSASSLDNTTIEVYNIKDVAPTSAELNATPSLFSAKGSDGKDLITGNIITSNTSYRRFNNTTVGYPAYVYKANFLDGKTEADSNEKNAVRSDSTTADIVLNLAEDTDISKINIGIASGYRELGTQSIGSKVVVSYKASKDSAWTELYTLDNSSRNEDGVTTNGSFYQGLYVHSSSPVKANRVKFTCTFGNRVNTAGDVNTDGTNKNTSNLECIALGYIGVYDYGDNLAQYTYPVDVPDAATAANKVVIPYTGTASNVTVTGAASAVAYNGNIVALFGETVPETITVGSSTQIELGDASYYTNTSTNIALSTYGGNSNTNQLIDGNTGNFAQVNGKDRANLNAGTEHPNTATYTINPCVAEGTEIGKIVVTAWGNSNWYPKQMKVSVSADNSTWTEVATIDNPEPGAVDYSNDTAINPNRATDPVYTIPVGTTGARYIKLEFPKGGYSDWDANGRMTTKSATDGFRIREVEVYAGTEIDTTPTATPTATATPTPTPTPTPEPTATPIVNSGISGTVHSNGTGNPAIAYDSTAEFSGTLKSATWTVGDKSQNVDLIKDATGTTYTNATIKFGLILDVTLSPGKTIEDLNTNIPTATLTVNFE